MNRVISAVIVLIGLAAPAWAGFDEGVAAYERGDHATALRLGNLGRGHKLGNSVPVLGGFVAELTGG